MRRSKEAAAESRRRIIDAAAVAFRKGGAGDVGIAEIMGAAGMTHGGFYRHFASKDEVFAAALDAAFDELAARLLEPATPSDRPPNLQERIARYLAMVHRRDPGHGCPLAALGGELPRTSAEVQQGLPQELRRLARVFRDDGPDQEQADTHAMLRLAAMAGILMTSRLLDDAAAARLLEEGRRWVSTDLDGEAKVE